MKKYNLLHRIYSVNNKRIVILKGGFGNKLNGVLNEMHNLDDVIFLWCKVHCEVEWEDLFSYPILNIEYTNATIDRKLISDYYYRGKGEELEDAAKFIKKLIPSEAVKREIVELPKGTIGYHVRFLSCYATIKKKPFKVKHNLFL